jgi:DNA-binding response OmpR family regulator
MRSGSPEILLAVGDVKLSRQIAQLGAAQFAPVEVPTCVHALDALHRRRGIVAMLVSAEMGLSESIELLLRAKTVRPDVMRLLLSPPDDLAVAVHGLHRGAIDRLIHLPFQPRELLRHLCEATQGRPRAAIA